MQCWQKIWPTCLHPRHLVRQAWLYNGKLFEGCNRRVCVTASQSSFTMLDEAHEGARLVLQLLLHMMHVLLRTGGFLGSASSPPALLLDRLHILLVCYRWWPQRKRSPQQLLLSSVRALPYVALCASVLALGLIAGFILASPLAPQVLPSSYTVV